MNFIGVIFYLKLNDFVSACFQERLHSVEGVFRGCSESDPVSDQWLWQLQEPDFRAYQDFPGAQRAATKKGMLLTNTLREMYL